MKSFLFVALLVALPQTPSFRSASSELVVLPVVVKDDHGRFVTGLPRDRFIVFDNGVRQAVSLFSNEDTPVSIALVVDSSGSMRGKVGSVVAASLVFARRSHPDDELFTIAFNDTVRDALGGRSITADDRDDLEAALRTLVPEGRTALYDAVTDGLEHLTAAMHARKVLVLVSDGGDNASRGNLNDVLAQARRENVTIYTIGLFDRGAPDTNPGVLKRLAASTGGERFLPQSPGALIQSCERIAQEIRSGYTLGYEPPRHDSAYHRIRVQVAESGRQFDVRTRPGYFAAGVGRP
jgi:Ca-activated chloride channel family protein